MARKKANRTKQDSELWVVGNIFLGQKALPTETPVIMYQVISVDIRADELYPGKLQVRMVVSH